MKQNIIYIGLDVDDTQYHGSALNTDTGEVMSCKCTHVEGLDESARQTQEVLSWQGLLAVL